MVKIFLVRCQSNFSRAPLVKPAFISTNGHAPARINLPSE